MSPRGSRGPTRKDATMPKGPTPPRGKRRRDTERSRVAAERLRRYKSGKSIREICGETGYSIGRVRRPLGGAGVGVRKRGGGAPPKRGPRGPPRARADETRAAGGCRSVVAGKCPPPQSRAQAQTA